MGTSHVRVDLAAITDNYRQILRRAHPSHVWAVVKGNGYGLGLERVVAALIAGGADRLVVGDASEALRLRRSGVAGMILTLTTSADAIELDDLITHDVDISVGAFELLHRIAMRTQSGTSTSTIQVEVDTGLGRGGFLAKEVPTVLRRIDRARAIHVRGMWSHLAQASDANRSRQQLDAFLRASSHFPPTVERHIANSAGLALGREFMLDAVRPGLALYGLQPRIGTTTCLSWTSRLTSTHRRPRGSLVGYGSENRLNRDSLIGLVPVGFADGYPRLRRGVAVVRGRVAPILGPVAMSMMVLDLTDVPHAAAGDEVSLLGGPGPSVERLLQQSVPQPIPNLFSCVRTASTVMSYVGTHLCVQHTAS